MTNWNNFNTAEDQNCYGLIPSGTIAKVRMTIKPGGYDDVAQGWTAGYATCSESGVVYLSAEFVVLEGEYTRRKVWTLIGLHSPKGSGYGNIGRSFIKAILNSARGISPQDTSEKAMAARYITGLADLDGLEFVARIEIIKDKQDGKKNEIKLAITPDHKDYAEVMGRVSASASVLANDHQSQSTQSNNNISTNRPAWASGGDHV